MNTFLALMAVVCSFLSGLASGVTAETDSGWGFAAVLVFGIMAVALLVTLGDNTGVLGP